MTAIPGDGSARAVPRPVDPVSGPDRATTFPLVDLLRGFCALSVVVYHVIEHFRWTGFPSSGPLVWFRVGWLGVDMFFVISGFVIAHSAFARLERQGTHRFRTTFFLHRFARLAPLHYLTCALFVLFIQPFMFFDYPQWAQFLTHGLFVHNLFPMHQGGINGVNWSLGDEAQFYILMLLAAPWLLRARWVAILVGGVAVAWAFRVVGFLATDLDGPFGSFYRFWIVTQLPGMLDEFVFGILLARLVRTPAGRWIVQGTPHRFWILPLASGGLVWLTIGILLRNGVFWDSVAMVVFFRTLVGLACVSLLLTACSIGSAAILRLTRPLQYLGVISFGIYLWHLLVIKALQTLPWLDGARALPTVIVVTLLLAAASWHLFERPMMQRLRDPAWLGRMRPARGVAVSAPVPDARVV